MESLFSKKNLPMVILNVCTILIIAIMLMVSEAAAKPLKVEGIQTFSNGLLSYQGTITDKQSSPLTGSYEMTFRIYPSMTGETALWTESRVGANAVPVKNGLFNVMLGSLVPIPSTVWEKPELYLGVKIGSDAEMSPLEKLSMVPSSARADVADLALTVPDGSIRSKHFSPTIYQSFNITTKENASNEWMQSGTKIELYCEIDCTLHIIHRGLTVHSNQGRVDVSVQVDGVPLFSELSDSKLYFQNVSGEGFVDLSAGNHTIEVLFICNTYDPGTCQYYGDEGGQWEHLYAIVYAQD